MYHDQISALLQSLGSGIHYMGHQYCITGLNYLLTHRPTHFDITKDIYPLIARIHNTAPGNVERTIRTVVTNCWYEG